ncbi:hypothetical protein G6F46_002002 [Rhizopus delemar]|uniref:Uncharacterized protein n=3 Tax=Rhizopus TaxID=4842 RepID=I1CB64_RHIO9|nr:hypothetical protein RO3G_10404 [Rhizopus delemar RA 99-880]KAG1446701.1 hypothetical protein G6F55_011428 [Rhizopus delemar]KAG1549814.1 hypothetical protein G6F51_002825 [Rhizopus arrhizus]KAG1493203.1 hypothetical protein G6F54_008750 [Rhizopus delemar]KAG1513094.1 hypothetical protein G6F53_004689 [Rhizopus delemar]|eukprot:EIE85694.1 hypothetical protein RO3G_10404 [Rhizopus delemar RA 99-880]
MQQQHDIVSIPIKTKKDIFHFRDATSFLRTPKRPKITTESISILSSITTIISPYNAHLSPGHKRFANQQLIDQTNHVSLKQFPVAYLMLKQALETELASLPHFIWTFTQPDNIATDDVLLLKTIQFVLTDFCNKCHRNAFYQPKYERSYWIDRIIPIFQTFGDQSQLLGFQWCEIPTEEHVEFTIDPDTWMRTTPIKYHDGVGYDINGCSRLVMEGSSSSTLKEDVDHTQDDTIKTLYASIEILTSFLRRYATASFSSLCSVVSYSLQCVCTTITLSTTILDPDNVGSYIQKEMRSVDIPLTFNKCHLWMQVFELVAYLFTSLREQEIILEKVMKESSGVIEIKDEERGLHILNGIIGTI